MDANMHHGDDDTVYVRLHDISDGNDRDCLSLIVQCGRDSMCFCGWTLGQLADMATLIHSRLIDVMARRKEAVCPGS